MAEGEEGAGNGEIWRASGVGRSQQRVANGGRGRVKGDPRELGAWMDEMPLAERAGSTARYGETGRGGGRLLRFCCGPGNSQRGEEGRDAGGGTESQA